MKFYSYHKMNESVYLLDDRGKMVFPKDFAIKDGEVVDTYYLKNGNYTIVKVKINE